MIAGLPSKAVAQPFCSPIGASQQLPDAKAVLQRVSRPPIMVFLMGPFARRRLGFCATAPAAR